MAKENVGAFFKELLVNEELLEKLHEAEKTCFGVKDKTVIAQVVLLPVAAEAGFEFTMEELQEHEKEYLARKQQSGELPDDDLEGVAGGAAEMDGVPMRVVCPYCMAPLANYAGKEGEDMVHYYCSGCKTRFFRFKYELPQLQRIV